MSVAFNEERKIKLNVKYVSQCAERVDLHGGAFDRDEARGGRVTLAGCPEQMCGGGAQGDSRVQCLTCSAAATAHRTPPCRGIVVVTRWYNNCRDSLRTSTTAVPRATPVSRPSRHGPGSCARRRLFLQTRSNVSEVDRETYNYSDCEFFFRALSSPTSIPLYKQCERVHQTSAFLLAKIQNARSFDHNVFNSGWTGQRGKDRLAFKSITIQQYVPSL